MSEALLPVEQVDRELFIVLFAIPIGRREAVRDGTQDVRTELQDIARHRIDAVAAEREACALRDMATAPKNGSYVLAQYRSQYGLNPHWDGRFFVVRHEGQTTSEFDLGWGLFPGYGGVPDISFAGWLPLPALAPEQMQEKNDG